MPIRIGIVGLGIGKVHVQNFQALPFDTPRTMRIMERAATDPFIKSWEDATGFGGEFAAFVECVQGKATPRATGIDGKRALQLGLAVKQSGRTGMPVEIEL
jgi:predicted dehydrogenase